MFFVSNSPKKIVLIRFSAMGDVVLLVPVVLSLLKQYPDTKITLLTHPFFHPFFKEIPNIELYPVDLKGKHKGFLGLRKLANDVLVSDNFEAVIDAHDVLRTWVLSFFFRLHNIPVYRIKKGRKEKRDFVKRKKRILLPHTTQRYKKVFEKAGFDFVLQKEQLPLAEAKEPEVLLQDASISIAIAPFTAHKSKQWGIENIIALMRLINVKYRVHFYLFGGGKKEVQILDALAKKFDNVQNLAGKYSLVQEMQLLQEMAVLLAMDSGNMHIASLLGIPVLSIWGGTHPDLGFKALYQPEEYTIEISPEHLACRPCSVFGTNTCHLTETPFACMAQITPEMVLEKMEKTGILNSGL